MYIKLNSIKMNIDEIKSNTGTTSESKADRGDPFLILISHSDGLKY